MEKTKHIYTVKVMGKNSAGGDISRSVTGIHANTKEEAKMIAKTRCNNFYKITNCIITNEK